MTRKLDGLLFSRVFDECKERIFQHIHLISKNRVDYHHLHRLIYVKYPRERILKYDCIYSVEWMLENGYVGLLCDKVKRDQERCKLQYSDRSISLICQHVRDLELFKMIFKECQVKFNSDMVLKEIAQYNTCEVFKFILEQTYPVNYSSMLKDCEADVVTFAIKGFKLDTVKYLLDTSPTGTRNYYNNLDLVILGDSGDLDGKQATMIYRYVLERSNYDIHFLCSPIYHLVFSDTLESAKKFLTHNIVKPAAIERLYFYLIVGIPPEIFYGFPSGHFLDTQLYIMHYVLNDLMGFADKPVSIIQDTKSKYIKSLNYNVEENNNNNNKKDNKEMIIFLLCAMEILWEFKYCNFDRYFLDSELLNIIQRSLEAFSNVEILPHLFELEKRWPFKHNVFDLISKFGTLEQVKWASENIQQLNDNNNSNLKMELKEKLKAEEEEEEKKKKGEAENKVEEDDYFDYNRDDQERQVVKFYHLASHKAMDSASINGDLEKVIYLLENRKEQCSLLAIHNNTHSKVIEYLLEMKPTLWDYYSCQYALETLDLEFMKKVHQHYSNTPEKQILHISTETVSDILTKLPNDESIIQFIQFLLDNYKEGLPFYKFLSHCCRVGNLPVFKFLYQIVIANQDKEAIIKSFNQSLEVINTSLLDDAYLFGLNRDLVNYIIKETVKEECFTFGSQSFMVIGKYGSSQELDMVLDRLSPKKTLEEIYRSVYETSIVYGNLNILSYIDSKYPEFNNQFFKQPMEKIVNTLERAMFYGSILSETTIYLLDRNTEPCDPILLNQLFIQSVFRNRMKLASYLLSKLISLSIVVTKFNRKSFLQVCWDGNTEGVEFIMKNNLFDVSIQDTLCRGDWTTSELDFLLNDKMANIYNYLVNNWHLDIPKSPISFADTQVMYQDLSVIKLHKNPLILSDQLFKSVFGNRYLFKRIFGWRPISYTNLTRDKMINKHPNIQYKYKYQQLGYPNHTKVIKTTNYKLFKLNYPDVTNLKITKNIEDSDNPNIVELVNQNKRYKFNSFDPELIIPRYYHLFYGNNSPFTIPPIVLDNVSKVFLQKEEEFGPPSEFIGLLDQDQYINTSEKDPEEGEYQIFKRLYHHDHNQYLEDINSITQYGCTVGLMMFLRLNLGVEDPQRFKDLVNNVGDGLFFYSHGAEFKYYQRDFQHLFQIVDPSSKLKDLVGPVCQMLMLDHGANPENNQMTFSSVNVSTVFKWFNTRGNIIIPPNEKLEISSNQQLLFALAFKIPLSGIREGSIAHGYRLSTCVIECMIKEYEKTMIPEDFEKALSRWIPNKNYGFYVNNLLFNIYKKRKIPSHKFFGFQKDTPKSIVELLLENKQISPTYSSNKIDMKELVNWSTYNRNLEIFKLAVDLSPKNMEHRMFKGSDPIIIDMMLYLHSKKEDEGLVAEFIGKTGNWDLYNQVKSSERWCIRDGALLDCIYHAVRTRQLEFLKLLIDDNQNKLASIKNHIKKYVNDQNKSILVRDYLKSLFSDQIEFNNLNNSDDDDDIEAEW